MSDNYFLDTNVLVYAFDGADHTKAWLKPPTEGRRDPRTLVGHPALTDAGYFMSALRALVRWAGPLECLGREIRRPDGPVCNSPRPSGPGDAAGH